MSEIKVNKITPRVACGTTQLGDSGDTFTIPSGATINNQGTAVNFGATGSASWVTTVKTGDFTAVAGEGYFVNTTGGEIDVTLPAGSAGAVVAVKDYANTWDTNNCILISNGVEKIGGSTNNAVLTTEGLAVTLIYIDSTQGWLVTDDGLQSSANTNPYIVATGGCISTCGNCKVHTFLSPGTFCVSQIAAVGANNAASYVVAAGGASGGQNAGGGGGAGGFREGSTNSITPYTASPLAAACSGLTLTATAYPIDVGGGGAGGCFPNCTPGTCGSNSTFSTISSAGGGGGGSGGGSSLFGSPGGSGGGVRSNSPGYAVGTGNTPPTTPAQGFDGGSTPNPTGRGAGGGGAGALGNPSVNPTNAGGGGVGVTTLINFSPVAFAGGGGAGSNGPLSFGPGSPCGTGGAGAPNSPGATGNVAGAINTGGGGGASGGAAVSGAASGGSGRVVIRYRYQ